MNRIEKINLFTQLISVQYLKDEYNWQKIAATNIYNTVYQYKEKNISEYEDDFNFIFDIVYNFFNLDSTNMLNKCRKLEIIIPNHICRYLTYIHNLSLPKKEDGTYRYSKGKYSLQFLAKLFGLKTHATLLHSIKTVNNLINTNRLFREDIKYIEDKINEYIQNKNA